MSEPVAFLQACAHSLQHLLGDAEGRPRICTKKVVTQRLIHICLRSGRDKTRSPTNPSVPSPKSEVLANVLSTESPQAESKKSSSKTAKSTYQCGYGYFAHDPPTVFRSEPRSPKSILKRLAISGVPLSCEIVLAKLHCKKTFLKLKHLQSFFLLWV